MTSDPPIPQSRELARCAEGLIAGGRFPFRRVETSLALLTHAGELHPSVVLWINRDSFMAGAVLLLAHNEVQEAIESGLHCARALGLRHFCTWSAREAVLWEDTGEGDARLYQTYALSPEGDSPQRFSTVLSALFEQFKLLSVLGAVAPVDLSPFYFANLARTGLESVFLPLTEATRVAQGDGTLPHSLPPSRLARHKGAQTLLRMLALLIHDRLPQGVQPDGLERAMGFALETLPHPLLGSLLPGDDEPPLPQEAAVRFHHLFRRLGQLHFGEDRVRAAEVLKILLQHEGASLGGYPLPALPGEDEALLLHCNHLIPHEGMSEIASAPLQALTALIRHLAGLPLPTFQGHSCFSLPRDRMPTRVCGTLTDRTLLPAAERAELTTRLRGSWPNRRFPLPPRTPRWAWEFVHLLGLCAEGTRLDLNLPPAWLTADFAPPLLDLIKEHFTIELLRRTQNSLHLRLLRGVFPETLTRIGAGSERTFAWSRLREAHRSLLVLALDLPDDLFSLLLRGRLILGNPEEFAAFEREIFLFSRSTLGGLLWRLVNGGTSLPGCDSWKTLIARGVPLPCPEVLERLRGFVWIERTDVPTADLDVEVSRLLEIPAALPSDIDAPGVPRIPIALRRRGPSRRALIQEVVGNVFADGIPRFPEQYLFEHYRPRLRTYSFRGPLTREGEFFGHFTLRDAEGKSITIVGDETARALEIASYDGRTSAELPEERSLTEALLERYLCDLRHLRQALLRQTHLKSPDPRGAEALAQRVWKSLSLPPWNLLDE